MMCPQKTSERAKEGNGGADPLEEFRKGGRTLGKATGVPGDESGTTLVQPELGGAH